MKLSFTALLFSCSVLATLFQAAAIPLGSFPLPVPVIALTAFLFIMFLKHPIVLLTSSISRFEASYQKFLVPFVVYAVVSAVLFPVLFEGIPVYVPRLGVDFAPTGNLEFGISNIDQIIFVIFNLCFFTSFLRYFQTGYAVRPATLFVAMGVMALGFTFYQYLSFKFGLYYPTDLINSNTSYAELTDQETILGYRLSGLFIEPSLNGNFLGLYFVFFIMRSVWSSSFKDVTAAGAFLIATVFVTSSLGYLEIAYGLALYAVFRILEIFRAKKIKYIYLLIIPALPVFIYFVAAAFQSVIAVETIEKFSTGSYIQRSAADSYAYHLLFQSFGLGVGLGSNRPSSLLAFLLSNVGVIGTGLFIAFLWKIISPIVALRTGDPSQKALPFAISAFFVGKYFGVPDISYQYFWMILILGAAETCALQRRIGQDTARREGFAALSRRQKYV